MSKYIVVGSGMSENPVANYCEFFICVDNNEIM